jgi:YidC/Oxa1 family membrane protein insertase
MDINKTFVFMIIIAAGFILFTFFGPKFSQTTEQSKQSQTSSTNVNTALTNTTTTTAGFSGNFEWIDIPQDKEYNLTFENKNIKIVFNPNDAIIKNAYVKDTFLNRKEISLYDLVQGTDNSGALRIKFGSWEKDLTLEQLTGGKNRYNYVREGNKFIFTCQLKSKSIDAVYTVKKIYTFIDDENVFKLDVEITNDKNIPINFDGSGLAYSIAWGPLLGLNSRTNTVNEKAQYNTFVYLKDNKLEKVDQNKGMIKDGNYFATKTKEGNDGWIGNTEHYLTTIICSDNQNYKYLFDYRDRNNKNYYYGYSRDTRDKSNLKSTFYVYIGPKSGSTLKKYDNFTKNDFDLREYKISKVEEPIFWGLGNGIGWFLKIINDVVKNFGLAIIILTLIIKLLIAPLTHKSMVSQQKMAKLQPKMKEIQEKYKDKPEILNKETMNLYKKEGVNPFGGCLPMLLQMPILMAMYELLDKMVDLKGSSFLWIKDLSLPDAILNFGFTIPLVNFYSLNLLPIIMTLVSVASTLLTPGMNSNKQTQMMMWMMPLIFFFLFYNVSSGLVLYWTIMNLLNLIQQVFTNNVLGKVKKA